MGEGAGDGATAGSQGGGPGALSRLLAELAEAPHAEPGKAWAKGLEPGDVLDRFEILRELGRGGFGAVYEALDQELGRKVALKTLRPGRSRDEWADEQLRREAQAAASLAHPGIVTLHEACTCDRGPYLVMELLRGETLEARLARGPLPHAEAVEVGLQIARALAHVHGHGLVHRDLKPGNVFLGDDGRVKLLDLGLAHLLGRKSSTGGTPAYVAPEQWRGEEVDGRADVFALGAVLFEVVSGRRAFEVKEERSSALDPGPAPPLSGKAPRGLARLVDRCLSKEPSGRPTAAQAAEELLGIQRGQARPRAVRRVGFLVGAGVALGVAVAFVALQAGRRVRGTSPDGRVLVAVADVVNETGERELDVLSGLLVTSLEQSRKLSVMTQARVLDLAIRAGRKDAARVDETIGREVGAAHGVRALLLPAIRKLGGTYSLEMRAVDPERDEHLFTLADRATSKEALLDLLDRLSERTRTELGEGKADVAGSSVQLGESMTRSLDAYEHYLAGLEAWTRDGLRAVGLREFEEALRLDPGFAAAHGQLADLLHHSYEEPGPAEAHWKAADAGLDRMPEKERLLYRLRRAHRSQAVAHVDREETLRLAEEVLARFPDDKYAISAAGDAFETFDLPDRWEPALRRALALDPGYYWAAAMLADYLGARTSEALQVARAAVVTRRSPANLALFASALWAAGDEEAAVAAAREVLRGSGAGQSGQALRACDVLYESGADAECMPVWRRMLQEGANPHERNVARRQLMDGLALRGRVRDALRLARERPSFEGDASPYWLTTVLHVGQPRLDDPRAREAARRIPWLQARRNYLAWLGAFEEAERIDATLERRGYREPDRIFGVLRLEHQGKHAEAAQAIGAIQADLLRRNIGQFTFVHAYYRAELLLAAGRPEEAAAVRTQLAPCRCTDRLDRADGYLRLALVRARALEQLGRRADAIRELDGVLAFWKEADQDLPLLVEAKAMRRRLAAQPGEKAVKALTPAATKAEATTPSIAVLPFADMSPGKDQEYLSDGIAEEILSALAQVEGLRVVGRTSSFHFKGRNASLARIGAELRVGSVLEGSVRREGNRLRVSAKLLAVPDGRSIWSESYDRELGDVLNVEMGIARAVVEATRVRIVGGHPRVEDPAPVNSDAHLSYLLGKSALLRSSESEIARALEAFGRAVTIEPGYSRAWAGYAQALALRAEQRASLADLLADKRKALDAAERAVATGPREADALQARGLLRALNRFEWVEGRADIERAIALGGSGAYHHLAPVLAATARASDAMAALRKCTEVEPLSATCWSRQGICANAVGDFDLARDAFRRALAIAPDHPYAPGYLAHTEVLDGRSASVLASTSWPAGSVNAGYRVMALALAHHALQHGDESRRAFEEMVAQHAHSMPFQIAEVAAWRGDSDAAFLWLERSRERLDGGIWMVRISPFLRPLHGDPRWGEFLRSLNLPVD